MSAAVLALIVLPVAPYSVQFGDLVSSCSFSFLPSIRNHLRAVRNAGAARPCAETGHVWQRHQGPRRMRSVSGSRDLVALPVAAVHSSCHRHRRPLAGRTGVQLRMSGYSEMEFDFESAAASDDDAVDPEKKAEDMLVRPAHCSIDSNAAEQQLCVFLFTQEPVICFL